MYIISVIDGDSLGTAFTQRDLVTVVDGPGGTVGYFFHQQLVAS